MVLHRKIRALVPWPVASTTWRDEMLRLWEVGPLKKQSASGAPGSIVHVSPAGIDVLTGDGVLTLTRLQAEGGKVLGAGDFLNGHKLAAGNRLGDEAHRTPAR